MTHSSPSVSPVSDAAKLHLLRDVAEIMRAPGNVRDALETVLERIRQTLPVLRGSVTLISPATGEIRIEASCGLKEAERLRGRYARGEGVTGRVIQTGQAMCVADVSGEPLFLNRTGSRDLEHEAISFLCVPIRIAGQSVGALSVDRQLADMDACIETLESRAAACSLPRHFILFLYSVTLSVYTLIFGSVPEGRICAWEPSSIQSASTSEAGIPSAPSR